MGYGVAMPKTGYTHLSAEEREPMSLGLAHGHSPRTMASVVVGQIPSTVSRELVRNAARGRSYRGCRVQTLATVRNVSTAGSRQFADPAFTEVVIVSLTQFTEADLHDLLL